HRGAPRASARTRGRRGRGERHRVGRRPLPLGRHRHRLLTPSRPQPASFEQGRSMSLTRLSTAVIAGTAGLALLAGCQGGSGGATSSTSSETRPVTDATGAEVEVPENPEAVATLHYAATETLMDLDAPPVAQGAYQETAVPEEWVDELGDIPVAAQQEPDLEKLAEAEPDLILSPNVYDSEMIEQLEEIAPVYQFTLRGGERGDWKQRVGEVADAVNKA